MCLYRIQFHIIPRYLLTISGGRSMECDAASFSFITPHIAQSGHSLETMTEDNCLVTC